MEVNLGEGILLHPTFGQRNADNLLEVQQVLGGRVVAAPPNRSEVEIIVLDELVRNLIQIAVLLFVGRAQKRFGQPQRSFVADHRSRGEADARQCPALFVVGTEDLHQRVTVRLLLAQIAVQNDLGGDLFLVEFEVPLNPQNVGGNGVQVQVQILSTAAFSLAFPFAEFQACGSMKRLIEASARSPLIVRRINTGASPFCWSCPAECKTTVRMLSFP